MFHSKRDLYDELSRVITNYEVPESEEERTTTEEMYAMLVKIQSRWDDIIASDSE